MTKRSCISPKDSTLPLKKRRVLVDDWEREVSSSEPRFTVDPQTTTWTNTYYHGTHFAPAPEPCYVFSPQPYPPTDAYPFRPWSTDFQPPFVHQPFVSDSQGLLNPPNYIHCFPYSQVLHDATQTEAASTPRAPSPQKFVEFQTHTTAFAFQPFPEIPEEKIAPISQVLEVELPLQADAGDSGISETSSDSSLEDRLEAQQSLPSPNSDAGSEEKAKAAIHKERRFDCEYCGRKFKKRSYLERHRRLHTGERPYSCDICGATFSQLPNLCYHKRIHTGESPYECDVCQRKFRSSSHLKRHQRLHTGEKPYTCPSCPAAFITWDKLNRHKMMDHS